MRRGRRVEGGRRSGVAAVRHSRPTGYDTGSGCTSSARRIPTSDSGGNTPTRASRNLAAILEIIDLHKRYGDVVALDGCTFEVRPGRMLGFLRPNGAGETTAMPSVFGLVLPAAGEVRWKGAPATPESRLRFGYMREQRGLYSKMTVHEQLVYMGLIHGMTKKVAAVAADHWLEVLG